MKQKTFGKHDIIEEEQTKLYNKRMQPCPKCNKKSMLRIWRENDNNCPKCGEGRIR